MPFRKVNVREEIEQKKKNDPEFAEAYEEVTREYELISEARRLRKEMGITQPEIAKLSGMTQQAISRIEQQGHSPTLGNFLKYIAAAGIEIKLEKKHTVDSK